MDDYRAQRCECGEPFVSIEDGWRTCARGHYERTPESRAEMEVVSLRQQLEGAVEAARAVVRTAQAAFDDVDRGDFANLDPLRLAVRALDRATSGGR